jgi:CheY-like chemotaxis protein
MPKHVLVVDDDKENADLAVAAIRKFSGGALTAEVASGDQAGRACLDRLATEPKPDLILLDMNMPGVSGADVIRALVARIPYPGLKILITTMWGPTWIQHWNLTDIYQTHAFKDLVAGTCDKGMTMREMVARSLQVLGLPCEDAA